MCFHGNNFITDVRYVIYFTTAMYVCIYMWQKTLIRWYICIGNADTVWILLTLEGDPATASEDLILSSHPQRKHIFMIIKDALEDALEDALVDAGEDADALMPSVSLQVIKCC